MEDGKYHDTMILMVYFIYMSMLYRVIKTTLSTTFGVPDLYQATGQPSRW
jgi:hypothetical protein